MSFGKREYLNKDFLVKNVQNVNKITYLGIITDHKLNYKSHVEKIAKQMSKFCGVLYKARYYFTKNQLLLFYESYAKSVITYGLIVYGCTTKTNLIEIFNLQKRIFRAIFFKRKFDSLQSIMSKFKLLNIFELCVSEIFREVFLQLADKSVHKFLNKKEILARRVTRNTTKGILPSKRHHKETGKKSLQRQLRLAHNYAAENNLIPENIAKMNHHQLNFLTKNFTFLYIFENQNLIDMFF